MQASELTGRSYFILPGLKTNKIHNNRGIQNNFDLLPENILIVRTHYKYNAFPMLPFLGAPPIIQTSKIVWKYTYVGIWIKITDFYGLHWLHRELTGKMYVFLGALCVLLQVFFLFDDLNHMLRYLEDYFIRKTLVWRKHQGRAHKFMQDVYAHRHIYTYTLMYTHRDTCAHTHVVGCKSSYVFQQLDCHIDK